MTTIIKKMNDLLRSGTKDAKFKLAETYTVSVTDKQGNFIRESLRTRLTDSAGNKLYINFPKTFDVSELAKEYKADVINNLVNSLNVVCIEKKKDGITYQNYYYCKEAIVQTV